jgi:NADPH:quinone reductase-like Zn-dependent oxidoreductase
VKIEAEPGFDPHTDVDVDSLRFGASEEVNFGRGCQAIAAKEQGRDLLVSFDGSGNGIAKHNSAAKLFHGLAEMSSLTNLHSRHFRSFHSPTAPPMLPRMTALVLAKIKEPLVLEDRPELKPREDEVVIQLKAAALNRRDYWIAQGLYPGIQLPVVLGSDGAGRVARIGAGVADDWMGKEVIINPGLDWGEAQAAQGKDFHILGLPRDGTFATEVLVPVTQLHPKPAHLDWREAAALPLAGVTAYRVAFSQGQLKQGDTVLITGIGGGVATFALQFAIAAGAKVWVTSSSPRKIQQAVELGAQGGFDYTSENWPKECTKVAGSPDLIIDSAAGPGYATLIHLAAPGARIVNYGATAGPPERLDLFKMFWKQIRLQGSTMGSPADFAAMLTFTAKHNIKPIIEETFPLAEGNQALEQMHTSPQFGKYVLEMG